MAATEIDSALSAPRAERGTALLALTENQWFDRKSARSAPTDLARHLVAFANAEGGTIVVGLHADEVEGFGSHPTKINDLRQSPVDFTNPPVRATFREAECTNAAGQPDVLLVIEIPPGEHVHETSDGSCYLRVGDESRRLGFPQRQELEYDKGQTQFDGLPVAGTPGRLDPDLLEEYRVSAGASRGIDHLLRARGLQLPTGEFANGCYLLFADHPQDLFPQAFVRVIRFLSTDRGTGSRLGVDDDADIRIEGPIPTVIHNATREIERLIPHRRALAESGRFESRPIVPRDAWLEGLVNAVIHRSYSLGGDHIRVEIYPNRIEIESPGRFPGLADPTNPRQISRFARNPRIARVCADLRIGQELGEGIKRIFDEMQRVGLSDPTYRQGTGSVRLVLAAVSRLDPATESRLPPGSQRVLDEMRAAGQPLGTGDLVEILGQSRPTVMKRLKALEREGLVRWVGKSARDPRAHWILADGH